jgi:fructokinase
MTLYGAVEGGGTKFLCAVATAPEPGAIVDQARFDTRDADSTLADVVGFFRQRGRLAGLGIASFGPVELDRASPAYGHILPTPKPGWSGAPVLPRLCADLGLDPARARIETDVNAAALGEQKWGAGRGADPLLYVTVGTGIGGGAIVDGRPLHGLLHPEMGHLPIPPAPLADGTLDQTPGHGCPFHLRCWEGLAAGPALARRLGRPPEQVGADDPIWAVEARYLALGLASCVLVLSPRRIVVGGGIVESRAGYLLPMVRRELAGVLGGYLPRAELAEGLDRYLVAPGLREPSSAIAGALALAGAGDAGR